MNPSAISDLSNTSFQLHFTGIGAEKAGTTKIADLLAAHPDICLSEPKEVHFFNEKLGYNHQFVNKNYGQSLMWYEKHFAHAKKGQLVGEFSTGYLPDLAAPKNIHALFPNIKLIVCLRNPIKRAYSQYIMYRFYFKAENRSFSETIRQEPEYIEKGLYAKQVKRYLQYFKQEQLHIIVLDDFKKNPTTTIQRLYHFLGVNDAFIPPNLTEKSNAAKAIKSPFISKLMGWFSAVMVALKLSAVLGYLKDLGLKKWVMKLNTSKVEHPPMTAEDKAFLQLQFLDDIQELEQLINKDLSAWKK